MRTPDFRDSLSLSPTARGPSDTSSACDEDVFGDFGRQIIDRLWLSFSSVSSCRTRMIRPTMGPSSVGTTGTPFPDVSCRLHVPETGRLLITELRLPRTTDPRTPNGFPSGWRWCSECTCGTELERSSLRSDAAGVCKITGRAADRFCNIESQGTGLDVRLNRSIELLVSSPRRPRDVPDAILRRMPSKFSPILPSCDSWSISVNL